MTHTRFHHIWEGIGTRCFNKKSKIFKYYGGRGIKCEWESFLEFKEDMYESYKKHSFEFGESDTCIERIDNDRNYSKENCKWATRKEQSKNKSSTRFFVDGGERLCLIDLAKKHGIPRNTLANRLNRGIPVSAALTMNKYMLTHKVLKK